MSAPIRNDDGLDDPLLYAPRWARQSPPGSPELSDFAAAPPTAPAAGAADQGSYRPIADEAETMAADAAAWRKAVAGTVEASGNVYAPPAAPVADMPTMAPGGGGFNIELPLPRLRPFEGDIAVKELRRRLTVEPEVALEPPRSQPRQPALSWIGRFLLLLVVAAVVTFCATLLLMPREARQSFSPAA